MRKFVLFFSLLLTGITYAQDTKVPAMLTGNSYWMYRNTEVKYNKESDSSLSGWNDCMYDDNWTPKETVDGREYYVLRRITSPTGVCSWDNIYEYHVREAEGKVYGLKDEYIHLMSHVYGIGEEGLFMEDCGDGELLLYDFTLTVGNRYPCKGDVTVASVDMLTTRDGVKRKLLCLSNGQKILENVGCISGGGELLGYQNTGPDYKLTYENDYYSDIYSFGGLEEFKQNDFKLVYQKGDADTGKKYYPILAQDDTKAWHYTYNNILTGKVYQYVEYFREKAIFNWKVYTKCLEYVDRNEHIVAYLREENGKLYMYNSKLKPSAEKLLYDFTLEVGDEVIEEEGVMGYVVTDVSYIDFQGRELKKLTFSPWQYVEGEGKIVDYDMQDIWVEGMGSNGGLLTPFRSFLTGNWSHLDYISFADGSRFSFVDIAKAKSSSTNEKTETTDAIYDLSGRRVSQSNKVTKSQSNKLPKGVYIQNGKKVVVK